MDIYDVLAVILVVIFGIISMHNFNALNAKIHMLEERQGVELHNEDITSIQQLENKIHELNSIVYKLQNDVERLRIVLQDNLAVMRAKNQENVTDIEPKLRETKHKNKQQDVKQLIEKLESAPKIPPRFGVGDKVKGKDGKGGIIVRVSQRAKYVGDSYIYINYYKVGMGSGVFQDYKEEELKLVPRERW